MDIYAINSISHEIENAKTKIYDIIEDRIINDISSDIYEYLDKEKITDLDYDFNMDDDQYNSEKDIRITFIYDEIEHIFTLNHKYSNYNNNYCTKNIFDDINLNFIPIMESIRNSLDWVFETYIRISHNMFNYPILKYEKITLLILCVNKYTDNILSWIPRDVFLIIAKDVFKGRFSSKYNQ